MANFINKIFANKLALVDFCYNSLMIAVDIISMDYAKSETDTTTLLYFQKENLKLSEATPILLLRYKMYCEEWNDIENYTKTDVEFWLTLLEKEYEENKLIENLSIDEFENDFFVERLLKQDKIISVTHNNKRIHFVEIQYTNPLNKNVSSIAKLDFARLTATYFLETEDHFVLFNWYTTA